MSQVVVLALLVTAVQGQLRPADAPPLNDTHDSGCGVECLRCAVDGCLKCARVLVWPSGACALDCPSGTRESWAHDDHLMGRVCYPTHTYNEVLVGGACGVVVCIMLVAVVAGYARCRSNQRSQALPLPQPSQDDDAQLRAFHKQLDCLRPHAYTLLAILNHTRHQVRELYQLGNNDAAMAYSCVLSDLAKLLILLNRPQVPVVPKEWGRLSAWADRILKRYSRISIAQQQQEQLVAVLPSSPSQASDSDTAQSFTTFKPPSYSPTSYESHILDKDLETQCQWGDTGRPPSYSQIERERDTIVLSNPWERRPIVRRESVWLEDELFEMTRRPQDELTTEL